MNPTQIIINTVDKMVKDLNLNLDVDEIRKLKEKALYDYCLKNGLCYFGGTII